MRMRIPSGWTVDDMSYLGMCEDGTQGWSNSIGFSGDDGSRIVYTDDITGDARTTPGEVIETRPLAQGGSVVARVLESDEGNHFASVDTGSFSVEGLGVSLTDQGGAVRPADTVCSANLCRSFSSIPLDVRWFGDRLDSTDDFFGSAMEERMLTVVASLQTHHDDGTRMRPAPGTAGAGRSTAWPPR